MTFFVKPTSNAAVTTSKTTYNHFHTVTLTKGKHRCQKHSQTHGYLDFVSPSASNSNQIMSLSAHHIDALPLLYEQHRVYTTELAASHAGLGKLYKKLTKLERKLKDKDGEKRTRIQQKKLWWTHMVTKQSIEKLEGQKDDLYNRLQQCNDLISSYQTTPLLPTPIWTPQYPPTPYIMATPLSFPPTPFVMTPYSPYPLSPWPMIIRDLGSQQDPQYWDLSMLAESQSLSTSQSTDLGIETFPTGSSDEVGPGDEVPAPSAQSETLAVHFADDNMPSPKHTSLPPKIDVDKANRGLGR